MVRNTPRSEWTETMLRKHLTPAIAKSHGRITIDQVFYLMNTDRVQVWFALCDDEVITALVTEVVEWVSGRKCLKVMLAGGFGSMKKAIVPIMDKLEEFAMLEVCASVMVEGRKGWERVLPDGYTFSHVTCEKELL
jgi:hypothetical protein